MTKKEVILKILGELVFYNEDLQYLIDYVNKEDITEDTLDYILENIDKAIDETNDYEKQQNLLKTVDIIRNIKQEEEKDSKLSKEKLIDLEKDFENI